MMPRRSWFREMTKTRRRRAEDGCATRYHTAHPRSRSHLAQRVEREAVGAAAEPAALVDEDPVAVELDRLVLRARRQPPLEVLLGRPVAQLGALEHEKAAAQASRGGGCSAGKGWTEAGNAAGGGHQNPLHCPFSPKNKRAWQSHRRPEVLSTLLHAHNGSVNSPLRNC